MSCRRTQIGLPVSFVVVIALMAHTVVSGTTPPDPKKPPTRIPSTSDALSTKETVYRNTSRSLVATDQTSPRIDRFTPTPGTWAVSNMGLPFVQVGFTETVTIPPNSVTAWTLGGGTVNGIATNYDSMTSTLTVTFSPPIRDDILTLVLDYVITDVAGNALDGEIAAPASASLPSGDGQAGGQAVFRISILQGDANRDAVVNSADAEMIRASLGKCMGDAGFSANADLNIDGCVDVLDVGTYTVAAGRTLPTTDGVAPTVLSILPDPNLVLLSDVSSLVVSFSEPIDLNHAEPHTAFLIDGTGAIHVPGSVSVSMDQLWATYTISPAVPRCNAYTLKVSNALADPSGSLLMPPVPAPLISGLLPPPHPVLDPHSSITSGSSITITGVATGGATVEVVAPSGTFNYPVANDTFSANVPLVSNLNNPLYFTNISSCGAQRSTSVLTIIIPPIIKDVVSREFSVYNNTFQSQINDAVSREFSVYNQP